MDTVTAFHASTLDKHSKASLADKVCNSVSQRAIDQWAADKEKKQLYARPELSSARVTGTPTPGRKGIIANTQMVTARNRCKDITTTARSRQW